MCQSLSDRRWNEKGMWFHFEGSKRGESSQNDSTSWHVDTIQMFEQMRPQQAACVQIFLFRRGLYAMNSYGMGSSSCGTFFLVLTKWASRGGAGCGDKQGNFRTKITKRSFNQDAPFLISLKEEKHYLNHFIPGASAPSMCRSAWPPSS